MFRPRSDRDLTRPRGSVLAQEHEIGFGDGFGIEHRIRRVVRLVATGVANGAIYDDVRDVDTLGTEFATTT